MLQIRHGIFETNSSSTHSLIIADEPLDLRSLPFVYFQLGNFGWEMNVIEDSWGRASYFYTAACALYQHDVRDEIIKLLTPLGIECIFDEENPPIYESYGNDDHKYLENGNIDHAGECQEFVDTLMNDGEMLARFLLSDKSFIVTGNDNCDETDREYMEKKVARADAYPHTTFYKGN